MSDEEAQFGTESPDARDLVAAAEPSRKKGKGKGGKTKGVNNAAGIPESVRKRLGYDTPPEENFQQRKNRLQSIRRYWAVRWYKYKSIPDWKWAMQFAFHEPYMYTMAIRPSYNPENRHLYYPKPPLQPHKNTLLTPDDFPEEVERLKIVAEKKRIKDEKKKKKLEAEGKAREADAEADAEVGTSKPRKRRLRKIEESPPPATSEEDRAHVAGVEAAAASHNDSAHDSAAEADDESDRTLDAPLSKKQKLPSSLKKKPGEKPPAARRIRIQEPADAPAPRRPIDTTDLVTDPPLASKPPQKDVATEKRSKAKHDPKAQKPSAQLEVVAEPSKQAKASKAKASVAKPGHSYAQVGTKHSTVADFHQKEIEVAEQRLHAAQAKAKAAKETEEKEKAALLAKQKQDLEKANQAVEAKQKLAEAKENEAKAAAEAKQLQDNDAKRQAALSILKTKKAERDARAAKKNSTAARPSEAQATKPVTASTPKPVPAPAQAPKPAPAPAPVPEAQGEAEQSHHDFPDPREGELWDTMTLHEVIWRQAEAIDPASVDIGSIYIPPSVSAMIETLFNQLRDLHCRDRSEMAKIEKFQKKASDESDEDFKLEAENAWKKIKTVNDTTKQNITIFQGKIKSAVEDCCKSHNASVMEAGSRKREAVLKDLCPPPIPVSRKRKVIPGLESDDDEADSHPPPPQCKIIRLTPPTQAPTVPEVVPPQAPAPPQAPPPQTEPSLNDNFAPPPPP